MRVPISIIMLLSLAAFPSVGVAAPKTAAVGVDAYEALGVKTSKVLRGTILRARVLPDEPDKQVVSIVTYLTGRKSKSDAINVKFGVFRKVGNRLIPVHIVDIGEISGGIVGAGDLQLLDLDHDGTNEIIVLFDDFSDPLIEQRIAVVYLYQDGTFVPAWQGAVEYDATRKAEGLALERRDRYTREIDLASTMRTRGITLFFDKRVIAVAGETLPQPKIVQETFPLRTRPLR